MISDASYCDLTKIASLSVFCFHTDKILKNIKDSLLVLSFGIIMDFLQKLNNLY